MIQKPFIYMV